MKNVIPFRPRRTDGDVHDIATAIFFALTSCHVVDPLRMISDFRKQHPEIRNVDLRLGFALARKAMAGFEKILLDHDDNNPPESA